MTELSKDPKPVEKIQQNVSDDFQESQVTQEQEEIESREKFVLQCTDRFYFHL